MHSKPPANSIQFNSIHFNGNAIQSNRVKSSRVKSNQGKESQLKSIKSINQTRKQTLKSNSSSKHMATTEHEPNMADVQTNQISVFPIRA